MRRYVIVLVAALGLLGLSAGAATAASPHFKGNTTQTCTVSSTTITCGASLAGLGNEDVTLSLSAPAEATFLCVNQGGNAAPGQNKVPFTATATQVIPGSEIKNGNLTFSITAPQETPTATAEQAGCPNPNWTTQLSSIQFQSVSLTISQGGTLLFTCSASGPFTEGQTVTLTCV